jgi:heat shock protein HslJ
MKNKATIIIVILIALFGVIFLGLSFRQNESFENTKWLLTEGNGINLEATDVEITLNFEPNKSISGYSGVNQFGGSYKLSSNNIIEFSEIFSTQMASMDPILNENERQYLSLLLQVKNYQFGENELILLDENNNVLLRFNPYN